MKIQNLKRKKKLFDFENMGHFFFDINKNFNKSKFY